MEKIHYFDSSPRGALWDGMWSSRTFEQELEACEIEPPPREMFLAYLPKDGKIVDAGCGFGKWVVYLHRRGYDILGIDNNEMAIAKLKEFDSSLRVEMGDILNLGYPDDSFDAYISMGVIEHFEEGPQLALREAHRILKPGGLVFVSVPTMNVLRSLLRWPLRNAINRVVEMLLLARSILRRCWRRQKASATAGVNIQRVRYRHFSEYRYSRSELEGFLRQAGFEILETVPHDFYDSRDHAAGLVVDFPFLQARNGVNFRLNVFGKITSMILNRISPWIACSSVLCLGRALAKSPAQ